MSDNAVMLEMLRLLIDKLTPSQRSSLGEALLKSSKPQPTK